MRAASWASRRSRSIRARTDSSAPSAAAADSEAGQRRHRRLDGRARTVAVGLEDRKPGSGLEPAGVHRQQERAGQLVGRGLARCLLFGLRGQPARLWSKLGQDVLDPGEVRLGLDELLLRPATTTLVAAHPGDLLEQRPALLGPQGQRLVDHPLPDEEECVVGEVGRVEQVDQVAQADPRFVQEVVVLTGAVQPPAELQDLVVDRQQAVGVVEDEGHVGHALRRALVRAGPDDVLGLARPERPALFAERPAQRVGEVALARSVGSDDGADPRSELDVRPLGERLEAVDPEGEQTRLGRAGPHALLGGPRRRTAPRTDVRDRSWGRRLVLRRGAAQRLHRLRGCGGLGDPP